MLQPCKAGQCHLYFIDEAQKGQTWAGHRSNKCKTELHINLGLSPLYPTVSWENTVTGGDLPVLPNE